MPMPLHPVTPLRQPLIVRLTHWANVVFLAIMIGSGLQIFDAHPLLYAADASDPRHVVFALAWLHRDAWPAAISVGGWLAGARRWHLAVMWLFLANGLLYVAYLFGSGEWRRRLFHPRQFPHVVPMMRYYATFRFLHEAHPPQPGPGYNALQRLTYTALVFVLSPLVILSGLAMAPAFDARFPAYVVLWGGRQFARTWHFAFMAAFVLFLLGHLLMVAIAGWPTFWSMITGGPKPGSEPAHEPMRHG